MFKVHKGLTPSYFSDVFCVNNNIHFHNTMHTQTTIK